MTRWRRFIVAIVVVIIAAVVVSFFLPENYEICTKSGYQEPEECTNHDLLSYLFWITILAVQKYNGAILALTTIFIGCFTYILARTERRHAELTEIVQRAYLSVEIGNIRSMAGEAGCVARIIIRNTGHMPATDIAWVFGKPKFLTTNQWKPRRDPNNPRGSVALAPNAEMMHGSEPFDIFETWFKGSAKYLYVWGYVRYNDGFSDGCITRFCHRYNMELFMDNRVSTGGLVFPKKAYRYNRHYNEML